KGFDLPGVALVGVVNADTVLNLPDFTAAERTFELLTQVLGRSGRGAAGGRGILQTYLPEHYAIRAAAAHDYATFAAVELEGRRRFGYPPFGRLVLLSTQAKRQDTVERRADELASRLREASGADAEVLGPAPAFAAIRCSTPWRRSRAWRGRSSRRSSRGCSRPWSSRGASESPRRRSACRSASRSWTWMRRGSSRSIRRSSGRATPSRRRAKAASRCADSTGCSSGRSPPAWGRRTSRGRSSRLPARSSARSACSTRPIT